MPGGRLRFIYDQFEEPFTQIAAPQPQRSNYMHAVVSGGASLSSYFRHCGVSKKSAGPSALSLSLCVPLLTGAEAANLLNYLLRTFCKSEIKALSLYINIESWGARVEKDASRWLCSIMHSTFEDGAWLFSAEHVSVFQRRQLQQVTYFSVCDGRRQKEGGSFDLCCGKMPAFCLHGGCVGEKYLKLMRVCAQKASAISMNKIYGIITIGSAVTIIITGQT